MPDTHALPDISASPDISILPDISALPRTHALPRTSKGIKHVTDTLTLGKMIEKSEYHKYQMICDTPGWGDPTISDLDLGKQYFAIKIDKNRAGSKDKIMLFEINLDYNTWINIGQLIQRQK